MSNLTNSLKYRMDWRSIEQFKESIQHHTQKEFEYIVAFVNERNGRLGRKKRDYVLIPWGARTDEIFNKPNPDIYRPDFLICKCYDNKYIVQTIAPIEVTTSAKLDIARFYLKMSKVDNSYV